MTAGTEYWHKKQIIDLQNQRDNLRKDNALLWKVAKEAYEIFQYYSLACAHRIPESRIARIEEALTEWKANDNHSKLARERTTTTLGDTQFR